MEQTDNKVESIQRMQTSQGRPRMLDDVCSLFRIGISSPYCATYFVIEGLAVVAIILTKYAQDTFIIRHTGL